MWLNIIYFCLIVCKWVTVCVYDGVDAMSANAVHAILNNLFFFIFSYTDNENNQIWKKNQRKCKNIK